MKLTVLLSILVVLLLIWITYKKPEVVIVTSHWKEDLNWLKKSKYPVVVIDHKGATPSSFKPISVIPNKGTEASVYLKYIVDNYYNLPEYIVFLHGHEHAWHQYKDRHILDMIHNVKLSGNDYISLNDFWSKTDDHIDKITKHWRVIEPWVGKQPKEHGQSWGSAQFIISRNRILHHPREAYVHWFQTIVRSDDDFNMGVMFERTWHYIFGEPWVMKKAAFPFRKRIPYIF
jgi:hypothetical protein